MQIDLMTRQITATYPIPSKAPTFLTRGPGNTVFVAPMLSGSNSFVHRDPIFVFFAGVLRVLDGEGPLVTQGLPDEDLF